MGKYKLWNWDNTVLHGVKQVYNNDRKTLIFW